jgi:hypothetical protein
VLAVAARVDGDPLGELLHRIVRHLEQGGGDRGGGGVKGEDEHENSA